MAVNLSFCTGVIEFFNLICFALSRLSYTGEYSPNTPNTNHAPFFNSEYNIPHISTTTPNTTINNNVGNAVKPSRKVSYGDVNTVSFHIPSTSTDVSPATSPTHASTVANTVANANTTNSTANNTTTAHTNPTNSSNPTHTETTTHSTSTKSHTSEVSFAFGLTSDDSSGNNSGTNSQNASSSNLLSESLRYDLQSEDGETVLEKRQAAAALALRAVHDRKNHGEFHCFFLLTVCVCCGRLVILTSFINQTYFLTIDTFSLLSQCTCTAQRAPRSSCAGPFRSST